MFNKIYQILLNILANFEVSKKMSKYFFISLFFTFYFAFVPNNSWACGNNATQQSCCSDDASSCTNENDDCCQNADSNSSDNDDEDCGGNCDNKSCHCTPISISLLSQTTFEEIKVNCFFPFTEKQKTADYKTYLSKGFISIWLPPKIS
jgi:hypothetical protein